MSKGFKSILIIADIEGSSGCWSYKASSFMRPEWYRACLEMTRDVDAVVTALFNAGAREVTVQDFHRTGYNLLPELIDSRATVRSGYRLGPVPGIGDPGHPQAVMFLGMHAASGSKGFLAHTLTSRIERLEVNGRLMAEIELFAASLAPHGVKPVFFSGCPIACAQARKAVQGIHVFALDKTAGPRGFPVDRWRGGLSRTAVQALKNEDVEPYSPAGPFRASLTMRGGEEQATELSRPWGFAHEGPRILIETSTIHELYKALIKLCYLTPFTQKTLPFALFFHRFLGRFGLAMVRRHLRRNFYPLTSR